MSKIKITRAPGSYRHKLLAGVSATALLSFVCNIAAQAGDDADRPVVWIELGGHLSQVSGQPDLYMPPFAINAVQHGLISLADLQAPPRYDLGEEAMLSYQPEDSDWIISAAIQYGRSNGTKRSVQDLPAPGVYFDGHMVYPYGPNYLNPKKTADYTVKSTERHAILDFQAGKDVGLGMFGLNGTSQLALGVRIAQLKSKTNFDLHADPDPHLASEHIPGIGTLPGINYYQFYKAKPEVQREFRGIGPSMSWNGSALMVGSSASDAELTFDWGAKAALLFGRQKLKIQHQTTGDRHIKNQLGPLIGQPKYSDDHYVNSAVTTRSHSVTVPNVGGFAGVSLKFPDAKVSIGYRADFFFGAMDGGIDTRKTYDRNFYGPFATISVGLGG